MIFNELKEQYLNAAGLRSILQVILILIPCRVLCMNIADTASGIFIIANDTNDDAKTNKNWVLHSYILNYIIVQDYEHIQHNHRQILFGI